MSAHPAWIRSLGPLVLAELRHRYAGSLLGGLWALVGPLAEVVAYAAVFGLVLKPPSHGAPAFALFIAAGLLPWSSLREALEGSAAALADNRWVRRSRVPVELLVARHVLVSTARAGVGIALVLAAVLARGPWPGLAGVVLPVLGLSLQTAAAYGLGLALAPLSVLHPDLRPALASTLTLLTFASPIVYPESFLTDRVRAILEWNPFTHILRLYRFPLSPLEGTPGLLDVAVAMATAVALVALGSWVKERFWWAARDRL